MDLIKTGLFLSGFVKQLLVDALLERVHAGCLLLLQFVLVLPNQKQSVLFFLGSVFLFSQLFLPFFFLDSKEDSLRKLLFLVPAN